MDDVPHFFTTPTGLGLTLSVTIFLTTIFLVAFRIIGFWITRLLLLFSLLTGITISNNDSIRDYLKNKGNADVKYEAFTRQILDGYDQLKEELAEQNKEVQKLLDQSKEEEKTSE